MFWKYAGGATATTICHLYLTRGDLISSSPTCISQAEIDRGSAYWAHRYVQNLAQIRYSSMIVDIQAASTAWEAKGAALVAQIQRAGGGAGAPSRMKRLLDEHSAAVLAGASALADERRPPAGALWRGQSPSQSDAHARRVQARGSSPTS